MLINFNLTEQLTLLFRRLLRHFFITITLLLLLCSSQTRAAVDTSVAVLCYHRFGPTVADSMTVRTSTFEAQLNWLREQGYHIIPLRSLVDYLRGVGEAPPERSVVITVDDGHRTVFSEMLPVIIKYDVPVTLFIYPSAISNASYALTWDQLRQMRANKNIDIQSHTYWHPNFDKERKRLSPAEFVTFTNEQLRKSKSRLEKELSVSVDLLAWPFGLLGQDLEVLAKDAGYVAAFSIVRRRLEKGDDLMSLPRFLMTDTAGVASLRSIVGGSHQDVAKVDALKVHP